MSLINDALKKAQRQRTEGNPSPADTTAPSTSSPEQLHRVARREKPAGFRSQLMLIGGGAVAAVILVGIGATFFFRSNDQPAATPAQPAHVAATPTPAVTAPVNPPSATIPPPAPAAPATLTVALPPAQATAPASSPAQQSPIASPATSATPPSQFVVSPATVSEPVAAPATSVATPVAADRPKPSTRMIGVIEHFRVGGIRVSGAESKVLMNDKVYRLNDMVDFELGIRLTGIETKALTFEDGRGAVHTRTF